MKTSDADYKKFRDYVYYWQRELGLDDWKIYVFHKKPEKGAYATTYSSSISRAARINLALTWHDRAITDGNLKECALHEVMHLVTADLYTEGQARFTQELDIDRAEHSIVVRMTRVIMRLSGSAGDQ